MRMKLLFALLVVMLAYATPSFAVCGYCDFGINPPNGFCVALDGEGTRCNNLVHPCVEIDTIQCNPHAALTPSLASRYQLASVEIRRSGEAPKLAETKAPRVLASVTR